MRKILATIIAIVAAFTLTIAPADATQWRYKSQCASIYTDTWGQACYDVWYHIDGPYRTIDQVRVRTYPTWLCYNSDAVYVSHPAERVYRGPRHNLASWQTWDPFAPARTETTAQVEASCDWWGGWAWSRTRMQLL